MIFVTVGAQMPFDRLVRTVDGWAGRRGRSDVFAQIGPTDLRPSHIRWVQMMDPAQFRSACEAADVIVAHAGMGSILTALELGKPILVMPRRGDLHETRNDHQIATAERMSTMCNIAVAYNELELMQKLDELDVLRRGQSIQDHASDQLVQRVRGFVLGSSDRGAHSIGHGPGNGSNGNGHGNGSNGSGPGNGNGHRHDEHLRTPRRVFDGIVCFGGEDWWYHNRGHYDMQMMRHLSRRLGGPVLYVNSLGMRDPSVKEGRMFLRRVMRKLKSLSRGMRQVDEGMWVTSVLSSPRLRRTALGRNIVHRQVRRAIRSLGMRRPLLWVACPPACEVMARLPFAGLVYQRTDQYESFPGADAERIRGFDQTLKHEADLTLYCSRYLYATEKDSRRAAFVDHGVDFDRFTAAARDGHEPRDLADIPHPRVGFVGGIDGHTFDADLFVQTTRLLPRCNFVMVGGCSLPDGMIDGPNVYRLGQKPYEEVAAYMAACDVLIMPWNQNEWIRACNPVKLKEYLAVGRPVVSTPFPELKHYDDVVRSAGDAAGFAHEIELALREPPEPGRLRWRVCDQTWDAKAREVLTNLRDVELVYEGGEADLPAEPVHAVGAS